MPKAFKYAILTVSVLLVVVLFVGGYAPITAGAAGQQDGAYREIGVYSEVLQHIQSDYVETPDISKVTTGALHGLLEGLDAESSYLSPEEYKVYKADQNSGKANLGINISKRFGYATVVSTVPGSPADKAGMTDGDIIEAVGPQSTREMSLAILKLMMDGQPGSTVTLSVIRPRKADPDKITLTRALVPMPALGEQQYESSSILYLKPVFLSKERVDATIERLKKMQANNNKKVLLDLRDVADGSIPEAIRLANAFIASGTISTLQGQKFTKQTFAADPKLAVTKAPLIVLVNRGTAGPGEVVAAAVLENKRGDVVGGRTFGEGAVQKLIVMPDGAALILSIAKYYGPDGKALEDDAVTPNVQVASAAEQELREPDESLESAPNAEAKPVQHTDDQLNKALELLRQKTA